MSELAVIFGLEGPKLTAGEQAFFRDSNPWAFILFARNIETPKQVRRLTEDIRACVGRDCLIFIDQEGGRVQRLRPPHWNNYPSAATLAASYETNRAATRRAVYLHQRLIADDLMSLGITADCAPVMDIPVPGADPIISDRAFGTSSSQIIDLCHAAMAGLMAGGVAPVIKHIPGHGRALVDSHKALPVVETSLSELYRTDFRPFRKLRMAPMAMTAHVVYTCADDSAPLTLSKTALSSLVRKEIGFDGLLMSDDLDMKALSGDLTGLTTQALAAGCDIALQCSGVLPSMVSVAKGAGRLNGAAKKRADIAMLSAGNARALDRDAAMAELKQLVPQVFGAAA